MRFHTNPHSRPFTPTIISRATLLMLAGLIGGCSMLSNPSGSIDLGDPILSPRKTVPIDPLAKDASEQSGPNSAKESQFFETPAPLKPSVAKAPVTAPRDAPNADLRTESALNIEAMPLPQFIQTIYGTILKLNVSIDPSISKRTDLVSFRTGRPAAARELIDASKSVLKAYGLSVSEFNGLIRVTPEANSSGGLPEIRRGRAQAEIPQSMRPIFYLVELEQTSAQSAQELLRTLYQNRVTVSADGTRNAILLSGQADSVSAAVEAIKVLDQPLLRGQKSARVVPAYWGASELAARLTEVLVAQGYSAGQTPTLPSPILVLPVPQVNSILIFATSDELLNHALAWAKELDQSPPTKAGKYITYQVRNTDAIALAKVLQDLLGGSVAPAAPAAPGAPAATGARPAAAGGARVVVNESANTIIIQPQATEHQQIFDLLQELDKPPRNVMIMATIAEVSLDDEETFGFNWLLRQLSQGGFNVRTSMGAPQGASAGLSVNVATVAGDPRAALAALASSNRVRVLSNPSIVTMNGFSATIQVGEDVPIVTSQISSANTSIGSAAGVQQNVQYRNTGTILRVKPVIYSGGRVDLDVAQEVSNVKAGVSGVGSSPVVSTRRIDTRLSATDGNTVLLGGLIREQRDTGNSGIPYLKDIPVVGAAFRTTGQERMLRTELVVLLTPHIIEDDSDARAVTDAFKAQFGWAKQSDGLVQQILRPFDRPIRATQAGAVTDKTQLKGQAQPAAAQTTAREPVPAVQTPQRSASQSEATPPQPATGPKRYPFPQKPAAGGVDVPSVNRRDDEPLLVNSEGANRPAAPTNAAAVSKAASSTVRPTASAPVRAASGPRATASGAVVTDADLLKQLMEAVNRGK
jgi:general secretion pathway protein D